MTAVAEHRTHQLKGFHGPKEVDGAPMTAYPSAPPATPWPVRGLEEELPADNLRDVSLASARLEKLQWELDAAEEELCAALRRATSRSVSAAALAMAAGITVPELENYLERESLGADSTDPLMSILGF